MKNPLILLLSTICFFALSCSSDDSEDPNVSSGGGSGMVSDKLSDLPKDSGGTHTAHLLGSTSADYGYYAYVPGGYDDVEHLYPLLVFLHGKSERGDGSSAAAILDKVLKHGPPKLIEAKTWAPSSPMIVVSPQYHGTTGNKNNWGAGDPQNLRGFIEDITKTYRVNPKRIYLTGLSHGGNGVYDYLSKLDEKDSFIAAAAPVAAFGAKNGFDKSANTPIWVFVGEKDGSNTSTSQSFVEKYNSQSPAPATAARFTVFPGAKHDVWTMTYNGEGIGKGDANFDQFDKSLYDWMLQFERN